MEIEKDLKYSEKNIMCIFAKNDRLHEKNIRIISHKGI